MFKKDVKNIDSIQKNKRDQSIQRKVENGKDHIENTSSKAIMSQKSKGIQNEEIQMSPFSETETLVFRKVNDEILNGDVDGEKLMLIIDTLKKVIRLNVNLENWNEKGIIKTLEDIKGHDIQSFHDIFILEYQNLQNKIGSNFFLYKDDVVEIYNKINLEKWNPTETTKEAEDYIKLKELRQSVNDFSKLYNSFNPLTLSLTVEEIDEMGVQWGKSVDAFILVYNNGSVRIKEKFKEAFEVISLTNMVKINAKLDSIKTKKEGKDSFEIKMSEEENEEKRNKLDPPYEHKNGMVNKKYSYKLFQKGIGDAHVIDSNDIDQGDLGDCYYLAAIAAIAKINPDFFKGIIKKVPDEKNLYKVTFNLKQNDEEGYQKHEVIVDNQFPALDFKPTYAGKGDNELWVMILEKALAKIFGHYKSVESGSPNFSFGLLTGKESEIIDLENIDNADLLAKLNEYQSSRPMVFQSIGSPPDPNVVGGHAYYLLGINDDNTLQLGNPHGKDSDGNDTHINSIGIGTLKMNFSYIYIGEVF